MPEFDDTGLQYVVAGNVNAANTWHRNGWPDSINNTLGAAAALSVTAGTGISNSSVTAGTGSKSFTLTAVKPWDVGTPVFLISQESPDVWIWGPITANDGAGALTINALKVGPTVDTKTLWTAIVLFLLEESLESFPLSRANGGLASAANEASCDVCEYPLTIRYHGEFQDPPTPEEDEKDYFVATGATGDWSGHDGEIAKDAAGGWTFRTPVLGWRAMFIENPGGVTSGADQYFDGTSWRYTGEAVLAKAAAYLKSSNSSETLTLDSWGNAPEIMVTFLGAGAHTLTLPAPSLASLGIAGKSVAVMLQAGSLLTVNVSGGGTIGDALSSVTTTTLYRVLSFKCMPFDLTGSTHGHWVQTAQSP